MDNTHRSTLLIDLKICNVTLLNAMDAGNTNKVSKLCKNNCRSLKSVLTQTPQGNPAQQFVKAHYLNVLQRANNIKDLFHRVYQTLKVYRYLYFDIDHKTRHYIIKHNTDKKLVSTNRSKVLKLFSENRNSENDSTLLDINYTEIPPQSEFSERKPLPVAILTYMPERFLNKWDNSLIDEASLKSKHLAEVFAMSIVCLNDALSKENKMMIKYDKIRSVEAVKNNIYTGLKNGVCYWSHKGVVRLTVNRVNDESHSSVKMPALAVNHGDLTPSEEILMANRANYLSNIYGVLHYFKEHHTPIEEQCGALIEAYISMLFDLLGVTKHFVFTKSMQAKYKDPFEAFTKERNATHKYRLLDFNQGYCKDNIHNKVIGPIGIVVYTTNQVYKNRFSYYKRCLEALDKY